MRRYHRKRSSACIVAFKQLTLDSHKQEEFSAHIRCQHTSPKPTITANEPTFGSWLLLVMRLEVAVRVYIYRQA